MTMHGWIVVLMSSEITKKLKKETDEEEYSVGRKRKERHKATGVGVPSSAFLLRGFDFLVLLSNRGTAA